MSGRYEFAVFARERRIVYREGHFNGRFGNLYKLVRFGTGRRTYGVADIDFLQARKADYIARLSFFHRLARKPLDLIEVDYLTRGFKLGVVVVGKHHGLSRLGNAALDSANAYSADVVVIVY